ncbi:MAG: DUF58 domain-containing protein [Gammaproteobacteria bacterium]
MYSIKRRIQSSRFFLGERAGDAPVVLNHRRIFILPTERGVGFALLMIVLLLVAFVYNNNLVYLLTFVLAGIFFTAILHCYKSLSGLVLQAGGSKPVFAGEAAGFVVHVANPTRVFRSNLALAIQQPERFSIGPVDKIQVTVYSLTHRRGWHQAETITISSTFPFGLFRAWSPIRFNLKALVYPKPSSLDIPFPSAGIDSRPGGKLAGKGGDDFSGLREYHSGDPIKRIHWKAFAKGQGLFSKQYEGENPVHVWLDYNEAPGKTVEERLSLLCRWVIDAEQAGLAFGFSIPGLQLGPDRSVRHSRKCMESLALF